MSRFLAWLLDALIIIGLLIAILFALGFVAAISPDFAGAVGYLAFFVISLGYGVLLEWFWRGRTVGKRVLRLQVIDERCLPLTFSQVLIRNLLRFVDIFPRFYMVGGVACLLTRRFQRLGDLAAGTVVIRTPTTHVPDLELLGEEKYNSFRRYPHLVARLRQRLAPQEARLVVLSLQRRDGLDANARVVLFSQLADHLRTMATFPPEAVDGLSDERYVQNVADLLFRSHGIMGKGPARSDKKLPDSAVGQLADSDA
ncbi:MAG: RDD family protein [Planctomycetota bacterium]